MIPCDKLYYVTQCLQKNMYTFKRKEDFYILVECNWTITYLNILENHMVQL
jgi:hypothetical protein